MRARVLVTSSTVTGRVLNDRAQIQHVLPHRALPALASKPPPSRAGADPPLLQQLRQIGLSLQRLRQTQRQLSLPQRPLWMPHQPFQQPQWLSCFRALLGAQPQQLPSDRSPHGRAVPAPSSSLWPFEPGRAWLSALLSSPCAAHPPLRAPPERHRARLPHRRARVSPQHACRRLLARRSHR